MNERFRFLLVGLFAWVTAVFFGGILLDMAYANLLKDVIGFTESEMIFSEIPIPCFALVSLWLFPQSEQLLFRGNQGLQGIYLSLAY